MDFAPIGSLKSNQVYPQQAGKQAVYCSPSSRGIIELFPHHNFEEALSGLEGFDRIWLIYIFHHNKFWKSKVSTPIPEMKKQGVFATRAPYRPNPIGLSCVHLEKIEGRKLYISEFDLLDQTPILDIKPYLSYADSFPEANIGWTTKEERFEIIVGPEINKQIGNIKAESGLDLLAFIYAQIQFSPTWSKRKRIRQLSKDQWEISFRYYRIEYQVKVVSLEVIVKRVSDSRSSN